MKQLFYPNYAFTDVWHIPEGFFKEHGILNLILDIDNTLVADNDPYPDENTFVFLDRLDREGISYCFVSNNTQERVEAFNSKFNRPAIWRAGKPLPFGIKRAMRVLDGTPENTAFIGDQLLTDMAAANLCGIPAILVNPINEAKETRFFKIKRWMERKLYERNGDSE